MIYIYTIIGAIIGVIIGLILPVVEYTYSIYLSVAIIAALDSVLGGIASITKKRFDMKIFLSGFFGNAIITMLLTYLGEKINVDIYLAAVIVFVSRMFNNLAIIRRHYINVWYESYLKRNNEYNEDKEDKKNLNKEDTKRNEINSLESLYSKFGEFLKERKEDISIDEDKPFKLQDTVDFSDLNEDEEIMYLKEIQNLSNSEDKKMEKEKEKNNKKTNKNTNKKTNKNTRNNL